MTVSKVSEAAEVYAQGHSKPESVAGGIDDLKHRIDVLESDKRKEERARSYLQIERDRILLFWEVTKKKLSKAEETIRQHSIIEQELVNSHSLDLKAYRQRLRHLLIEQADKEAQIRLEAQSALQELRTTTAAAATATEAAHATALQQERAARLTAEQETAQCRIECEERIAMKCREFEEETMRLQNKYEQDWLAVQKATQETCAAEIRAAEGKMEATVAGLRQQQATALKQLHDVLETQAQSHSDTLNKIQEENKALREKEAAAHRQAKAATAELKNLTEAHTQAQSELVSVKKQLRVATTEASLVESTKQRAAGLEKKVRDLQVENEALRVQLEEHGVALPPLLSK